MSSKKIINIVGLFLIFIFIFLTIYTSLYAAGYRLNWHWQLRFDQLISKTGMLIVQTTPRNVDFYLKRDVGGFLTQKEIIDYYQTPAKIQNLLPGKYNIHFEKDDYWPISRNFEIYPNQTTTLTNIFLFKKSLPLNIYEGEKEEIVLSDNKDKLILLDSGKVINLDKKESVLSLNDYREDALSKYLGNNILLNGSNLYDLDKKQKLFNVQEIIDQDYLNFDFDLKNNILYYNTGEKISYIDINKKEEKILLDSGDYLNFFIKDNLIYTIEANQLNYYLRSYNLDSLSRQRSIIIPSGDYKFTNQNLNLINLYDSLSKRLILIEKDMFLDRQRIVNNVDNWRWFENNLLWQKNNEIYRYNLNNNEKKLLLRLSQNVTDFIWQTKENYLIYSTKNSINIVYFKNKKNDHLEILRAQNIGPLYINDDQSILYFYAETDNQSGIFKLLLH